MPSKTSKRLEKKQKQTEPVNDIIEIRYIPIPPEKREAYQESIRFLAMLLIEIVNEEELSQVNNEELAVHEISSTFIER